MFNHRILVHIAHNTITVIAFPLKAMNSADAYPTWWRCYYRCLEI